MNSRQALGSFIPGPSKTLPEWNANALSGLGTDDFNGFMTIYNNNRCTPNASCKIHAGWQRQFVASCRFIFWQALVAILG